MENEILSVSDFCKVAGISRALFYTLLKEGKAPNIIKVGKRTLISRKAFEKWIADLETATANDNHQRMVNNNVNNRKGKM